MIQHVREQLGITREDLAAYLGLSLHMVKSIEMGRRLLPKDSQEAVAVLMEAIKTGAERKSTGNPAPADSQQIRLMKSLYRKCSIRLRKYSEQLDKMQKDYTAACAGLVVYEHLAQAHTPARNDGARARQKWALAKIAEMALDMRENNETAQEILAIEIASLKNTVQGLEASRLFPFKTTK